MRRKSPPENFEGLKAAIEGTEANWQSYECELVTPMYGGGVKPGEVDREMPIRATAIRGQLRFWWRIACGPFQSRREMFEREMAIWGGIGGNHPTASNVEVVVQCPNVNNDQLIPSNDHCYDKNITYAYGAATNNGDKNWLTEGHKFVLRIKCTQESMQNDIYKALRWWACFGGIGGRTRRGFGAIKIENIKAITDSEIKNAECKIARIKTGSPISAWQLAAGKLQKFRQGKGFARSDGQQNRPGRSYWPEPDQLRRDTDKNDNGRHMPIHKSGNVFPRAAFGLPIIFDFHKSTEPDKSHTELLPADAERMASPLILRPSLVENTWYATALLLPTWEQALKQQLRYKKLKSKIPKSWKAATENKNEIANHIPAMVKSNGELRAADPLSAFMQFFAENN